MSVSDVFCIKCKHFMEKLQSGISVFIRNGKGEIYRTARADLYNCHKCNIQVISSFSKWNSNLEYVKKELENEDNIKVFEVYNIAETEKT